MSKGDYNKFSIPTTYKKVQMRSKLESKVAMFLDGLKIKWIYEPTTFLLSDGIMYKPDFYLPKLKMWIEVKGVIGENNHQISRKFVEENKTELILIGSKEIYWFSTKEGEDKSIHIGKCSHCKSYFLCSTLGSFHCRKCLSHEGDHDIRWILGENSWSDLNIDFSDLESIKNWLQKYGTRI